MAEDGLAVFADAVSTGGRDEALRLIAYDPDAELQVIAAALYSQAGCSFETALSHVRTLREQPRFKLVEALLGNMGRYDVPLRALEHAVYTFDAQLDQGAYFELKRHRMMTQTPQRLTAGLGYAVPRLIAEAGYEEAYRRAMDAAKEGYHTLAAWNPQVAAYVVPNGFNRRVLMTLNLREVFHLCELRSQPNAHFSMRRLALRMAEIIREVHPVLAAYMRLPEGANWREVEEEHFAQV